MADDKYILTIDADGKPFVKTLEDLEKKTEKTGSKISESFKDAFTVKSVGDLVLGIGGIAKVALFAADQLKKIPEAIFEGILEGEKISKINKQFDILASQAGLVGASLKETLAGAGGGLADEVSILQASSEALIQLGTNAKRLPETLELARKVVKVFGGDLIGTYESINQAIATGNIRSIKQLGIIVDTDQVYKNFAKTIGTTSDLLTVEQKQFALSNAVLEKGKTAFANISTGSESLTQSIKILSVAYTELKDLTSIVFAKSFGPTAAGFVKSLSEEFKLLTTTIKEVTVGLSATEKVDSLETRLKAVIVQREKFAELSKKGLSDEFNFYDGIAKKLQTQIGLIKEKTDAQNESDFLRAAKSQAAGTSKSELQNAAGPGLTIDQIKANNEAKLATEGEFISRQIALRQQGISAELASAQLITDNDLKNQELDRIAQEQEVLQTAIYTQQKLEIEKTFSDLKHGTIEQRHILEQEAEQNHQLALDKIQDESAKRQNEKAQALATSLNAITKSGLVATFKNMGAALAQGQNALTVFGKGILSLIGNILVEIGSSFITIGLGVEAIKASIIGLTGGPAIAAGLALVVLGGLLSSLGGGGSSAPSSGSSAGAGAGSSTSPSTNDVALNDSIQERTTSVKIEVGGTVLDPISVGLQIADILNNTFNSTGTKVAVS